MSGVHFFFFQAEDGIRDYDVTGVQTCALPIYPFYRGDASLDQDEAQLAPGCHFQQSRFKFFKFFDAACPGITGAAGRVRQVELGTDGRLAAGRLVGLVVEDDVDQVGWQIGRAHV